MSLDEFPRFPITLSLKETRAVLGTFRKHPFSSAAIISVFSRVQEKEVEQIISYLVAERFIYQSVGGTPKRYSLRPEPRVSSKSTFDGFMLDQNDYIDKYESDEDDN